MFKTFEQQRCQRIVKCTLSFDNRVFACLYRHGNLRDHIELFLQFAGKLSELLFLSSFFRCGWCNISRQDRLAQVLKLIHREETVHLKDIMTRDVEIARRDTLLSDAAKLMRGRDIGTEAGVSVDVSGFPSAVSKKL